MKDGDTPRQVPLRATPRLRYTGLYRGPSDRRHESLRQ